MIHPKFLFNFKNSKADDAISDKKFNEILSDLRSCLNSKKKLNDKVEDIYQTARKDNKYLFILSSLYCVMASKSKEYIDQLNEYHTILNKLCLHICPNSIDTEKPLLAEAESCEACSYQIGCPAYLHQKHKKKKGIVRTPYGDTIH